MKLIAALMLIWLCVSMCHADIPCPEATHPIPESWRCTPDGQGPFTYYVYQGCQAPTPSMLSLLPSPTDFSGPCLQEYRKKFEKDASFATSSGQCFPQSVCSSRVHVLFNTTQPYDKGLRTENDDFTKCLDLVFPQSAINYTNGRRFLSVPEISCAKGFVLNDETPIFCDHNGVWISGTVRRVGSRYSHNKSCIRCFDPPAVANGKLVALKDATTANLVCNEGSTTDGEYVVASYNEMWSAPNGTCKQLCPVSKEVPNGFLRVDNIVVGSTATLVCHARYRLVGNATSRCLDDGKWSMPTGNCEGLCGVSKDLPNGFLRVYKIRVNSTATLVCHDSYTLVGNATSRCLDDGNWSIPTGKCEAIRCPGVNVIPNGKLKFGGSNPIPGDIAFVECNTGFRLMNQSIEELTCNISGNWTMSDSMRREPRCEAIFCPPVPDLDNGEINNGSDAVFSTRTFTCDDGYQLQGNENITCVLIERNPVWLPTPPTCTTFGGASEQDQAPTSATISWISSSTSLAIIAVVATLTLLLCVSLLVLIIVFRKNKRSESTGLVSVKYETNNRSSKETGLPTEVVGIHPSNQGQGGYDSIPSVRTPGCMSEMQDELTSPSVVDSQAGDTLYAVVGIDEKQENLEVVERESTALEVEDDFSPPSPEPTCPSLAPLADATAATPSSRPDLYTMVDIKAKKSKRDDPAMYTNASIQADIDALLSDPIFGTSGNE